MNKVVPYYGLAIGSFFAHIAAIHSLKMKRNLLGINSIGQAYIILIVGILCSIAILYGLTNVLDGIDIPKAYEVLIGQ